MGANNLHFLTAPDYSMPAQSADGSWGSLGGVALRDSLHQGSASGVMDLLKSMDASGLVMALSETGFAIDAAAIEQGRGAIFTSVKERLGAALELQVDGFGLEAARKAALEQKSVNFAAKANAVAPNVQLDFSPDDFDGNLDAARVIQGVMRASSVSVDLVGGAKPSDRNSLLLVAGQAMKKGVQGFGFEGVPGKYKVPLEMADLVDLHRQAAENVAITSARVGLGLWAQGAKVKDLDEWVPDSVQRLLHGSISLGSAKSLINAIDGGGIAQHAGEIGDHQFADLLKSQGLDPNARTVEEQAEETGFVIQEPNRMRGQYYGPVVAVDHRASLVKYARQNVILLSFTELAKEQERPKLGDAVRMDYKNGQLSVEVANRVERSGGTER